MRLVFFWMPISAMGPPGVRAAASHTGSPVAAGGPIGGAAGRRRRYRLTRRATPASTTGVATGSEMLQAFPASVPMREQIP